MGVDSWFVNMLLVLITMLACMRAHGIDFDADLSFSNGIQPWGREEDEELEPPSASAFSVWRSSGADKTPVNVDSFGAVGDGIADDTQIAGTIVAPEEPKNWDPKNPRVWLVFSNLEGARIQGGGVIDGSGSKWWAASFFTAMQRSTNGIASPNSQITADTIQQKLVDLNFTRKFSDNFYSPGGCKQIFEGF